MRYTPHGVGSAGSWRTAAATPRTSGSTCTAGRGDCDGVSSEASYPAPRSQQGMLPLAPRPVARAMHPRLHVPHWPGFSGSNDSRFRRWSSMILRVLLGCAPQQASAAWVFERPLVPEGVRSSGLSLWRQGGADRHGAGVGLESTTTDPGQGSWEHRLACQTQRSAPCYCIVSWDNMGEPWVITGDSGGGVRTLTPETARSPTPAPSTRPGTRRALPRACGRKTSAPRGIEHHDPAGVIDGPIAVPAARGDRAPEGILQLAPFQPGINPGLGDGGGEVWCQDRTSTCAHQHCSLH